MATFTGSDNLQGAEFVDTDLRGARFVGADLAGVVMRGVQVERADIDAPWLFDGDSFLLVNGVDVIPFVEAELNRRFPGRAERRAKEPDSLRAAWATLERTWAATLERVATMPATQEPRTTASACRSSRRSHRRTGRCSRSGRAASRWCATSSRPSRQTC